ncbi:MAG: hypothetical protein ACOX2F_01110 [bacterium]
MLSSEMRVTREFERYHFGWFCHLSVNFNKPESSKAKSPLLHGEKFGNVFISSEEMDEIRNQINYMLEAEDEENETTIDPSEEADFEDAASFDDL